MAVVNEPLAEMVEALRVAVAMRKAQREYCLKRSQPALVEAKRLEGAFDMRLAALARSGVFVEGGDD